MEHADIASGKTIEVVAGILWRGVRYLAVQRPEGKAQAGWWEFPGGKVERGEDTSTALIRELAEELGVQATDPHFWQSVEHGYASTAARSEKGTPPTPEPPTAARRVHIHFYHVHSFSGEPSPCEGQTLRWVTPTEALHLPFLAADVPIVEQLHAAKSGA